MNRVVSIAAECDISNIRGTFRVMAGFAPNLRPDHMMPYGPGHGHKPKLHA